MDRWEDQMEGLSEDPKVGRWEGRMEGLLEDP